MFFFKRIQPDRSIHQPIKRNQPNANANNRDGMFDANPKIGPIAILYVSWIEKLGIAIVCDVHVGRIFSLCKKIWLY